jgi:sigma-E factor negative regulatory protein RseC
MSQKEKTVDHLGRVQEITSTDIVVKILSQSACASCHANGACGMSDSTEKMVVVHKSNHNYTVGQSVKVMLRQSLGFRALLLGYVLPFLIVLLILIFLTAIGISEGKSGLLSLFALVPYYAGLYLLRDKVSKQFTFDIVSI